MKAAAQLVESIRGSQKSLKKSPLGGKRPQFNLMSHQACTRVRRRAWTRGNLKSPFEGRSWLVASVSWGDRKPARSWVNVQREEALP